MRPTLKAAHKYLKEHGVDGYRICEVLNLMNNPCERKFEQTTLSQGYTEEQYGSQRAHALIQQIEFSKNLLRALAQPNQEFNPFEGRNQQKDSFERKACAETLSGIPSDEFPEPFSVDLKDVPVITSTDAAFTSEDKKFLADLKVSLE